MKREKNSLNELFLEMTLVVLGVLFDDESLIVMIVFFKYL
jgi:hypothetical protein